VTSVNINAFVVAALLLAQTPASAASNFDRAKALYHAAEYEEALTLLVTIDADDAADRRELDVYRALCLLALGRTADAERALAALVVFDPMYEVDAENFSPRLVSLFRDVRMRTLPAVVRNLYLRAKASYDRRDYVAAASEFHEVLALIPRAAPAGRSDDLQQLTLLAAGFAALAADSAAASARELRTTDGPSGSSSPAVYTPSDRDVVGPVEIVRPVPTRVGSTADDGRLRVHQGLVEVLINEQGLVESAEIRRPISPAFDASLLEAIRLWRFQPALRHGVPVRFRRHFEVVARSQ
jgi:TonB family protein